MPPIASTMAAISCTVPVAAGTADVCFASSFMFNRWQARRESNPQPAVLETAALPIELLAYSRAALGIQSGFVPNPVREQLFHFGKTFPYFKIFATTPAPTVRPPSR